MRLLAILAAGFAALTSSSAHADVMITAGQDNTSVSSSGYFDFSSPDQIYASSGTYAGNPVPTNSDTDLASGITPIILSGALSGGSVTNLTDGPAQTNNDDVGASAFSDSPITFRIDLGSNKEIAQFNSYTWQSGVGRAQQTYTLLAADASVADPSNLSLYTTIASVNTYSTANFTVAGQQGVSIQSNTGTLGTYRYIVVQDATSNGSFYGEFDVIASSHVEPATHLLALVKGISGIELAWSESAFPPGDYRLERSSNGGAFETIARIPVGTYTWFDADVQAGIIYRYRLLSYNAVATASTGSVQATMISGPNAFPPSALLSTRDYGAMWWRGGVRGERVWQIKTSRYAMTFACDSLNLSTIFPLSSYLPETVALVQPNELSFPATAPVSNLACTLTTPGSTIPIIANSTNNDDAQLLESGKFFQRRWQKIKTGSAPALNTMQSGMEVCAWPDRVSIVCRVVPTGAISNGGLRMVLTFENIYNLLAESGAAKALARADGSGFVVFKSAGSDSITVDNTNARVTVDTAGGTWQANQERSVGLVIYPSSNVASTLPHANGIESTPLLVTAEQIAPLSATLEPRYDKDQGYFQIPMRNDAAGADENRVERNQIVVSNTTSSPQLARFAFTKNNGYPYAAGYSCILRDADGNPLGIPVQLSKNWHTGNGERWEGAWFHGLTMLMVPAHTTLRFEALLVGQNYGGVPAVSHSQLSLVGWGGNQQWEESAIGCWGESFCYDPDSDLASAIGTDSRPLLLLSHTGQQKQWTGNYGGCDFIRYSEGSTRRFQNRIRTHYQRYGPNLTDVTYAGLTDNSKLEFQYSASIYRSNDYSRARHRIRYDVKADAPFTRMVFFQLASDNYNYNGGTTHAYGYGNQLTRTAQWTTTNVTTPVQLTGPLPWFSTLGCPVDSNVRSQTGATRGFVIRSWKARINGQQQVNPYFVSRGSRFDLVPPPGITTLKSGDYVEAEIERFYFGQAASAYYGGDSNFTTAMQSYGNTHQMALREVIGNNLAVTVSNGLLEKSYPIQIRAVNNTAQFSVTRGVGYVPMTFTGLSDYRKPLLEEQVGAGWVAVNQATVGKDFWQADYEPTSASWQITFNVKLDAAYQDLGGLRDAPVTRTFRFRQEGAPVATVTAPVTAVIPGVAAETGITLDAGDTPVTGITLSAVSSDTSLIPNASILFSGSGSNRTLTYTPTVGSKGTVTITIYATDEEGKTTVQPLLVTVDAYLAWSQRFFTGASDPNIVGDHHDPDGDGASNLEEYAAGTDPLNPTDHFKAVIDTTAHGIDVSVSGRAGRSYVLERSITLEPDSWQEIARTGTHATDQPTICNDPAPPATRTFYRMRVIAP